MKTQSTGDRRLDSLRDRAASKIIWGEDEQSVYKFLRKEGVSAEMANQFVDAGLSERRGMLRRKSMIRLIAGSIGAGVCGGLLLWFFMFSGVRYAGRGFNRLFGALLIGLIVCVGYSAKHLWIVLSGKSLGSAMEDGT